jgi:hypothetical protein
VPMSKNFPSLASPSSWCVNWSVAFSTTVPLWTVSPPTSVPPQLQLDFGAFVHVNDPSDPSNSLSSRYLLAIALDPSGNLQGDNHCMTITTGRRILRRQWTVLPMPESVIHAISQRGLNERQPLLSNGCPLFAWDPHVPVPDLPLTDSFPLANPGPVSVPSYTVPGGAATHLTESHHITSDLTPEPERDDQTPDHISIHNQHENLEDLSTYTNPTDLTGDAETLIQSVILNADTESDNDTEQPEINPGAESDPITPNQGAETNATDDHDP